MSHLTLETLARLIDDTPDPTEAGHLDICEACRVELEALRADSAALRTLPDPEPPIAAWVALDARLKREGLMRHSSWTTTALRMAAVFVIFVVGSIAGGLIMRQQNTTSTPIASVPVQRVAPPPVRFDAETVAASPQVTMATAPLSQPVVTARVAVTAEEAVSLLRDAERSYLSALSRFSELTVRNDATDPVARLAALESIVATTRAALGQAPADPVINGYHLTAVAQRDATLRQIAASQPNWY